MCTGPGAACARGPGAVGTRGHLGPISAGTVHPGAGALRAGGSWRDGGLGRRPHIPPVAGGCRATVRRREEGRGPGGGGPWQPGQPGRMTMEGNALSEAESRPRGRGGRGPALAALGHTTPADAAPRSGGHAAAREATPDPERGTLPDPLEVAALRAAAGAAAHRPAHNSRKPGYLSACCHAYTTWTYNHVYTGLESLTQTHFREGPPRTQVQTSIVHNKQSHLRTVGHAWSPKSHARNLRQTPSSCTTCLKKFQDLI